MVIRFPLKRLSTVNFESKLSPVCEKLHFQLVVASSIREEWWQHLHWEDCQHSIVTAFSPVCENTLPDVCTPLQFHLWQSLAGQLEHLRNYFHSLPPPMANLVLDDDDANMTFNEEVGGVALCGKKILVRASIGSWLPLNHSHANTKALSRCNPQLWNPEEMKSFFKCLYQWSSATDPIWLNFLLLLRFFDLKNRSQPPLFLLSQLSIRKISTNWSQFVFLWDFIKLFQFTIWKYHWVDIHLKYWRNISNGQKISPNWPQNSS